MKQRIITASFLIVILGSILYFSEGEWAFLMGIVVVLFSAAAAYEFSIKLNRYNQKNRWFDYLPIVIASGFALANVLLYSHVNYGSTIFILTFIIVLVLLFIYLFEPKMNRNDLASLFVSVFYSSVGFIALGYLRTYGLNMILYLLIITIMTDTFAYFIGIKFGKHRLAVNISPKKSIEGAVAGLVLGALSGVLFAHFMGIFEYHIILVGVLSIGISFVSQGGDLIASKFKREVGIKDFSQLFPGHGGILDRFDSTMIAALFLMIIVMVV